MAEKAEVKLEALPDLDDLLQCPVCYEIPTGQIFQCNEGHHVCGQCKLRLDVCPVCRALFFGTRNYAMEELIANVRKLRAFKLGGKVTTGSTCSDTTSTSEVTPEQDAEVSGEEENQVEFSGTRTQHPPPACKGLFRCLCCKGSNVERLPAARLLNHLRYFHRPELIEGQSENGEYVQAWQFPTVPGRLVTAVRVCDMGIFFLIIEINNGIVYSWLSMAASPWIAREFSYTVTISGNDREAIFSDCVWSVRSCEGSLKKRGHCLTVNGLDARALIAPLTVNGKLTIRRTPADHLTHQVPPRAVLRVANRGNNHVTEQDLEPFLQGLQNDVARLSRAFVTLGQQATTLLRSESEIARRANNINQVVANEGPPTPPQEDPVANPPQRVSQMSRHSRRRMRLRLRNALNATQPPAEHAPIPAPRAVPSQSQNGPASNRTVHQIGAVFVSAPSAQAPAPAPSRATPQDPTSTRAPAPPAPARATARTPAPAPVLPPPVQPPPSSGPSNGRPQNENNRRVNKKKHRQHR